MNKLLNINLIFILFVFSACTGLQKSYPERNYYVIEASIGNPKVNNIVSDTILKINRFNISPENKSSNEFVYRLGNDKVKSDFYNQFFINPGNMIGIQTMEWLSNSKLFEYVFLLNSDVDEDYILNGNVSKLYGDFSDSPLAVMEIEILFLKKDKGNNSKRIIFFKRYNEEIKIASTDPNDLVEGWNKALTSILANLENDIFQNISD